MSPGKVKLAILSSAAVGFLAGGILMVASPALANTNGSTSVGTTATGAMSAPSAASTAKSATKAGHPKWLQMILRKNADKIASDLNITKQQLFKDLSSGKSLDDIAISSGVSQSQLESELQSLATSELDARVAAGHMTSAHEAKIKENLNTQLPKFMANQHLMHKPNTFGAKVDVLNFAATELHLTRQELVSKLKSGLSINQIATAQGVSTDKLQTDLTQKLDSQVNSRVEKLLNRTGWFQHNGRGSNTGAGNSGN